MSNPCAVLLIPAPANAGWTESRLAANWRDADGFAPDIRSLLRTHPATASAVPLLAVLQHQVPLANRCRASETELWVLARTRFGLCSMTFTDPSVAHQPANAEQAGDVWPALGELLEIGLDSPLGVAPWLVHRTLCALLEARRFFAPSAAVIVQAWDRSASLHPFLEFQNFVALMGGDVDRPGAMVTVPPREGIALYFGWAAP